MKRLILVRHAKSSWSDWSLQDIDRPLNKRGLRDGPFMANKIKELIPHVDLFLVSPAKRARLTSEFFAGVYPEAKIKIEKSIYEAYFSDLERLIRKLDRKNEVVMMFGHNPGYTILANKYAVRPFSNLPTCGIAIIDASCKNWGDFDETSAEMKTLIYPKQFLG